MRLNAFLRVAAIVIALSLAGWPQSAAAQDVVRVRVTRQTPVLEQARGDSFVLGRVAADTVLQFLQQNGRWVQVAPIAGVSPSTLSWRRGWVLITNLTFVDPQPGLVARRRGELLIRAFGYGGVTLFTAKNSFEAMFDTSLGPSFGGGAQVVLPNGLFVQGSAERFQKTGSRLIVSNQQVFRTTVPNTVRLTPLQGTVGYRDERSSHAIGYIGAGLGWQRLEEQSPALASTDEARAGKVSYHVLGGAEFRWLPGVWLAGEVQWTSVPKALGEPGIGPVYQETDLGGTAFRIKLIVGR